MPQSARRQADQCPQIVLFSCVLPSELTNKRFRFAVNPQPLNPEPVNGHKTSLPILPLMVPSLIILKSFAKAEGFTGQSAISLSSPLFQNWSQYQSSHAQLRGARIGISDILPGGLGKSSFPGKPGFRGNPTMCSQCHHQGILYHLSI